MELDRDNFVRKQTNWRSIHKNKYTELKVPKSLLSQA